MFLDSRDGDFHFFRHLPGRQSLNSAQHEGFAHAVREGFDRSGNAPQFGTMGHNFVWGGLFVSRIEGLDQSALIQSHDFGPAEAFGSKVVNDPHGESLRIADRLPILQRKKARIGLLHQIFGFSRLSNKPQGIGAVAGVVDEHPLTEPDVYFPKPTHSLRLRLRRHGV
ncbi:hypothetical protein MBENS4_4590 [Novosphingobium sp. MBES04]|nr:hypothetical protein MBENS4_4590 [Novosphingobium sp. MBES04]